MSAKRELHTLFIKHDTDFGTLSKQAVSDVILKIILLNNQGTRIRHIKAELDSVVNGSISEDMVLESLKTLERNGKVQRKGDRYTIHPDKKQSFENSVKVTNALHERMYSKYLSQAETDFPTLRDWFQDTLILFFENFSMEWFSHLTTNGKLAPKKPDNTISSVIDESLLNYGAQIKENDKSWLKINFIKFYESEESDENLMFWNFGISMFCSRLITAKNYADKASVEAFRNGCFLLDTNILMILDLEGHEFGHSFRALDKILHSLNIKTKYLNITKLEYRRAISGRKADTIHVFEEFDSKVLETTNCPFVKTAIKRGCRNAEDIERMFEKLMNIPKSLFNQTKIEELDYAELDEEVQKGCSNEELKSELNEIYFKRLKKDKRENPLTHDAGMVNGVRYLKKNEPVWILTTDGTLKVYSLEKMVRNENDLVIGLDALIGLLAVNGGGVLIESSDFAPLFKNLVKNSLIPEESIFDVRDLSFILSTKLRINELDNDKVIEIANEVRRMRVAGKDDGEISLFLRREIEGQKLTFASDINKAKLSEMMALEARQKAERERDAFLTNYREQRRGELRDKYDKELLNRRLQWLLLPLAVGLIVFITIKFGLDDNNNIVQYLIGCSVELIFGILPLWPIDKSLRKKYSEYVIGIDKQIEKEISEMRKNSQ